MDITDITISKSLFERYVPAFRVPGSEDDSDAWDAMTAPMATAKNKLLALFGDNVGDYIEDTTAEQYWFAVQYICVTAARDALAGADVILTENGFGVVSNDHIAPASRERVEALAHQLRKDTSNTADSLLLLLRQTDWAATGLGQMNAKRWFYSPSYCRRVGLATPEYCPIFREEYDVMEPRLREAEALARRLWSDELIDAIVAKVLLPYGSITYDVPYYCAAANNIEAFMVAHIRGHRHAEKLWERETYRYLQANKDSLSEWASSEQYTAYNSTHYANKKHDTTYFFG